MVVHLHAYQVLAAGYNLTTAGDNLKTAGDNIMTIWRKKAYVLKLNPPLQKLL